MEDVSGALESLRAERDRLVRELEGLEKNHEKGTIQEEEYTARKKELERKIVEVMDRIVQMEFLLGQR